VTTQADGQFSGTRRGWKRQPWTPTSFTPLRSLRRVVCVFLVGEKRIGKASGKISVQAAPQAASTGNQSDFDARLLQRLKADPELKTCNIKIVASNGVATLSGTVATEAVRAEAGSPAKVDGVNRVDNQIVVDLDEGVRKTGEAISDAGSRRGSRRASSTANAVVRPVRRVTAWTGARTSERAISLVSAAPLNLK
jgi:hypothetical protein